MDNPAQLFYQGKGCPACRKIGYSGRLGIYEMLRMNEMPKVEVHIVPSTAPPTGVGEPGVAPVGPAVANAIFAATGKRMHMLPFPKPDAA